MAQVLLIWFYTGDCADGVFDEQIHYGCLNSFAFHCFLYLFISVVVQNLDMQTFHIVLSLTLC